MTEEGADSDGFQGMRMHNGPVKMSVVCNFCDERVEGHVPTLAWHAFRHHSAVGRAIGKLRSYF